MLHGYAGAHDVHGNELVVTEVAVADEIAAAADLVKGKLTGIPVAVVRGLTLRDNGSNARALLRPGEEDLFWLGTEEALAMGRGQAQLLRRSVRRFSAEPVPPEIIEAAVGGGAHRARAAPHPAGAVRVDGRHRCQAPAAGPHERQVAIRPRRRRQDAGRPSSAGSAAARSSTTRPNW